MNMSSELEDFKYFKTNQLVNIDFTTGVIDVYAKANINNPKSKDYGSFKVYVRKDVGSVNEDGYIRLWCHKKLRMKHRLIWFLSYGKLPDEIDHIDGNRSNNALNNLRSVTRQENLANILNPTKKSNRKYFSERELHIISKALAKGYSQNRIARVFNCKRSTISSIATKHRHKDISDLYFEQNVQRLSERSRIK